MTIIPIILTIPTISSAISSVASGFILGVSTVVAGFAIGAATMGLLGTTEREKRDGAHDLQTTIIRDKHGRGADGSREQSTN